MADVRASVGKYANGTKLCYNRLEDKQTVRDLLNRIPVSQGGTQGKLPEDLLPPQQISEALFQAIREFQKVNQERFHLFADGHVDPHERTIAAMTRLAEAAPPLFPASTRFLIQPVRRQIPLTGMPQDMFFHVVDPTNVNPSLPKPENPEAFYWFGFPNARPDSVPDNVLFEADAAELSLSRPLGIDELAGPGIWEESVNNNSSSTRLNLLIAGNGLRNIVFKDHQVLAGNSASFITRHGMFQLVRASF
jgi:hypothetical protein